MMSIQTSSPKDPGPLSDEQGHRLVTINRWLIAAVAVLGLAVLTLAIDAFVGFGTDENAALADDVAQAWSTGDTEAIAELYAEDAVVELYGGAVYRGIAAITQLAERLPEDLDVVRVGDVAASDGWIASPNEGGMAVLQVEDGRIVHQWNF